jgi:predicted metal-dependent phosphoesterase TrpH
VRGRVHVRSARTEDQRAAALRTAAIFVPAPSGEERLRLEAAACAAATVQDESPEAVAHEVARLASEESLRARIGADERVAAEDESFARVAAELDAVYMRLASKRRLRVPSPSAEDDPLADRDWIVVDLHMHTDWSHDCSTPTEDLLDHAERIGLGAIAITDHNAFGGALEAIELAPRGLVVIPGEEVKTDGQGEVIGLFLGEEVPRGMSFAETIEAIRDQGGLVYLPHPFDRLHAIPDPATLHRHLAEIDVLEVFNARLLRESFNDEALRFAQKYRLLQGAGSDAHVLQGVGTGAVRMRRFEGPEEFLLSLRNGEILRRPKSLAYLQSLKWVAQVKEKVL